MSLLLCYINGVCFIRRCKDNFEIGEWKATVWRTDGYYGTFRCRKVYSFKYPHRIQVSHSVYASSVTTCSLFIGKHDFSDEFSSSNFNSACESTFFQVQTLRENTWPMFHRVTRSVSFRCPQFTFFFQSDFAFFAIRSCVIPPYRSFGHGYHGHAF